MYDDVDVGYYAQMIGNSCSLEEILMDWASKDPIGAEWFTEAHYSLPLTLDRAAVESYLDNEDPLDILFLGARSAGRFGGRSEYFEFSEDDRYIRALSDEEVGAIFLENFRDNALPDILAGRLAPPDEIAEVVEMWKRKQKVLHAERPPYQARKARPAGRFVR